MNVTSQNCVFKKEFLKKKLQLNLLIEEKKVNNNAANVEFA